MESVATEKPRTYWYFVAYQWADLGRAGFGNTEIGVPHQPTSIDQVIEWGNFLATKNGWSSSSVIIVNYILLRTEGADDGR